MVKTIGKNLHWVLLAIMGIVFFSGKNLNILKDMFSRKSTGEIRQTSGATISEAQAQEYAAILYDAMEGTGTDEESIFAVFRQLKNQADYNLVSNMFGAEQYSRTWGNVGDPLTSDRHVLSTWIASELNKSERDRLKKINPAISF